MAALRWGSVISTCPGGHESLFLRTNEKTAGELIHFLKEEDTTGAVLTCRQCNAIDYPRKDYAFRFEAHEGKMTSE